MIISYNIQVYSSEFIGVLLWRILWNYYYYSFFFFGKEMQKKYSNLLSFEEEEIIIIIILFFWECRRNIRIADFVHGWQMEREEKIFPGLKTRWLVICRNGCHMVIDISLVLISNHPQLEEIFLLIFVIMVKMLIEIYIKEKGKKKYSFLNKGKTGNF